MAKDNEDENKEGTWTDTGLSVSIPSELLTMEVQTSKETEEEKKKKEKKKRERLKAELEKRSKVMSTSRGILQILPELEYVRELLTAQTLSPKTIQPFKLKLSVDRNIYDGDYSPQAINTLIARLNTEYKMEKKIPRDFADAIFYDGAKIHLIIPPALLNYMAKQAGNDLEAFDEYESNLFDSSNTLTDNPITRYMGIESISDSLQLIAGNDLRKRLVKEKRAKRQLGIDMEAMTFMPSDHIGEAVGEAGSNPDWWIPNYRGNTKDSKDKSEIKLVSPSAFEQQEDEMALTYTVDADIFFPVTDPHDVTSRQGGYLLADEKGHFVTQTQVTSYMEMLSERMRRALKEDDSDEMTVVNGFLDLKNNEKKDKELTADFLLEEFTTSVREEMQKSLDEMNGGTQLAKVGQYKEFYQILFSRMLTKEKTRLIYVPEEYFSYLAFDYNEYGIGVSLLERTAFISSVRAIVNMASVMNYVRNSITQTNVNVVMDEDDMDQKGTLEMILQELAHVQTMGLPFGTTNPSEIYTALTRAGMHVKVEGSMFPNTTVDFEESTRQTAVMDMTLDETLQRQQYLSMGVTPEQINQSLTGEFASVYIINDLQSAARAMQRQIPLCEGIEDRIFKIIRFSPHLQKELKDEGVEDVATFARAIRLQLPKPDMAVIQQHAEAFDQFSQFIDNIFENAVISDMALRSIIDDSEFTSNMLDQLRSVFTGAAKRNWLRDNNAVPEIWDLVGGDPDGHAIGEIKDFYTDMFKTLTPIVKGIKKVVAKQDEAIAKLQDENNDDQGGMGGGDASTDMGGEEPNALAINFDDAGNAFADEEGGGEAKPEEGGEETPPEEEEEETPTPTVNVPGQETEDEETPPEE